MGRKSYKAGAWHHTKTNKRNVKNNRGRYKWSGKIRRKKEKRERIRFEKRMKGLWENTAIIAVIIAIISAMCYLSI